MGEATPPAVRRVTLMVAGCLAATVAAGCGSSVTTTTTAPGTASRCVVTIATTNSVMPAAGGAGRVNVNTDRECGWTATSDAGWLSITSAASGQGEGAVEFRASANPDPVARRGSLMLNDQRAEVSQSAADCSITLSEPGSTFTQAGGSGTIGVVASSPMCTWTASTDAPWISITSAPGKGSASVSFVVSATTGPPRAGTVNVAGQQFSVTQGQGCNYVIHPQSQTFGVGGGNGTINLATGSGCPWVSSTNVPWIHITQGASGAGPGVVTFSVDPTTGPARAGTVLVAGSPFTVDQTPGCTFQVAPTTVPVNATGGTGTIAVTTAPGCAWTAASGAPWLTVTAGSSGTGNGTVSFSAQATTGPARSGTLTVANQTVTVNQSPGCSFSISPESQSFTPAGGTGDVAVTASTGCSWAATSNAPWLTITQGSSGSGNGTVRFSVAANSGSPRSGTLTIAGRTFTVNQGQTCTFTLSPNAATVPAGGGSRTFNVQAGDGCSWTATSNAPWITVAQGGSGSGNGTVRVDVAAHSGAPRTGTVTVAGVPFTVNQESGCSFSLSANSTNVPIGGGPGNVNVQATAGCGWTASSGASWITITGGASGTGNGTVQFTVAANTGPARSGTLTIAGSAFTVNQAGVCAFGISPQQQPVGAAGGSVNVAVTTTAGCTWTASSNAPWISVTQGASGTGPGAATLSVASTNGPARNGTATIAGNTFTVQQASGCTFTLNPTSRSHNANGGDNSFNVSTNNACPWKAVSDVPWIRIENGSDTGNGRVDYDVDRNNGPARKGTITVGSAVFTVMQSGS